MTINANEIIEKAEEQTQRWRDHIEDAAEWFHYHERDLFDREEAVDHLTNDLDIDTSIAQEVISNLVSDTVDPVVQIVFDNRKYVGIIEYREFDGAYGYANFDDNRGKERRVVCAQCVKNAEYDSEVTHATAGDPKGSFNKNTNYQTLLNAIHKHYDNSHDSSPENVETGATLASGTTIGGNTSFHAGNDGAGSGLSADTVQGNDPSKLLRKQFLFGDGSDGAITRSSNTTETRNINATTYTVDSSVTVSVTDFVFISATEKIEINGTINADGEGAQPSGGNASLVPLGPGGSGGANEQGSSGKDGGDGDTAFTDIKKVDTEKISPGNLLDFVYQDKNAGAAGGNGGRAQSDGSYDSSSSVAGSPPGGGGSGGVNNLESTNEGGGGSGGAGGGLIYLSAPTIEITGSVTANGINGNDGGYGNAAGGGGGGGGSGGVVVCRGHTITGTSNISVEKGLGGSGGGSSYAPGADGADGATGEIIILEAIET